MWLEKVQENLEAGLYLQREMFKKDIILIFENSRIYNAKDTIFYKFADIYWATGSLIVASAIQIAYFLIKKQPIPKRNLIFFGLIAIFGGLTIYMHDDTFLKWKVTIIQGIFAIALIVSQKVFNKKSNFEFTS